MIAKIINKKFCYYLLVIMCCYVNTASALTLKSIQTKGLPGNKAQILLSFDKQPQLPTNFSLSSPAQMVFDFVDTRNALPAKLSEQNINLGVMSALKFVSTSDRVRMIIKVSNIVPYTLDRKGTSLIITLDNDLNRRASTKAKDFAIESLDFRRGENGEGRVVLDFSDKSVPIDFKETDDEMTITFSGATVPASLQRRFDVSDFGTNVNQVIVEEQGRDVVMRVFTKGDFEKVAYQTGKQYIVETRPVSLQALSSIKLQKIKFSGERISLNFQDIAIRAVLQLLADFSDLNIVVSDTVSGNVTMRLDEVPWDQALDYILQSKGLAKRVKDDVILVGPADEILAREQLELETTQQVESLLPLESEYIQINYARASDMVSTIKDSESNLLSSRGQVSFDERTNTLLVKDIATNIVAIRQIIERLDVPVRQVVIEAQLVQTGDTYNDDFGLRMNGAATPALGKYRLGVAPNMSLAREFADDPSTKRTSSDTTTTTDSSTSSSTSGTTSDSTTSTSSTTSDLFFDFGGSAIGQIGLALARLPGGTLLDLELRASEVEGKTKTIARPKLMTLDQQQASIETGQEIPFATTSESGATPTTSFKKAVLRLDVTPQITPNNKIAMNLSVSQDKPGALFNGQQGIDTTSMSTNVLVDDGETIVLGGIFSSTESSGKSEIPYLSKIPLIGTLFRTTTKALTRAEILIFVTPKVVKTMFER